MRVAPPWTYRCLIILLSPLIIAYTVWRSIKDGGRRYLLQRLALSTPADLSISSTPSTALSSAQSSALSSATPSAPSNNALWVHATSVGEVNTIMPLLESLLQAGSPRFDSIILTTTTPTGASIVQQRKLPGLQHHYLPVDFAGATDRFVSKLAVSEVWVVETEIWPWLYARCRLHDIAVTIVNGRLTDKTMQRANGLLAAAYRVALPPVNVLARSQSDADKFITLGADANKVVVAGNLKYASNQSAANVSSPLEQSYVLAASTHHDEEIELARLWLQIFDQGLFVIAPRHPERGGAISQQLAELDVAVGRRSRKELPQSTDRIYVADTVGELDAWYAGATAAFIGGSLINRGGHNMLEAARHGCPIVVGPHTENFADIMQLLNSQQAATTAVNSDAVMRFLLNAWHGDPDIDAQAQRARLLAVQCDTVVERYIELLLQH